MGADVVHRQNIGVIERGGGARFLLEAPQPVRIGRKARGQHLNRHIATEPRIARTIDLVHAAHAERRENFVRTEARPDT